MPSSGRLRVIAGSVRGQVLKVPPGIEVRPTLDRVREALFSILGPALEGARFADLFAGSGANGIEALSRGAAACTFIDGDPHAIASIRDNLTRTGLLSRATVIRANLPGQLPTVLAGERFKFVFADPPYALDVYREIVQSVAVSGALQPNGWLILEHETRRVLKSFETPAIRFKRTYRYGESSLTIFEATELQT